MSNYTKQTLSEALAKKLGIDSTVFIAHVFNAPPRSERLDVIKPIKVWLIESSEKMAELAWNNDIDIMQDAVNFCVTTVVFTNNELHEFEELYADFDNDIAKATRWAIGLALMESK